MDDSLHTVRFLNESNEYRGARAELLKAEIDLRRRTEEGDQIPALNVFVRRGGGNGTDWYPRLAY